MSVSAERSILARLSEDERLHSQAVASAIRARITASGGWLAFDAFMDLALYAPGLGYYSAGAVKLGAQGDFVTAPESSRLFGACLARQCAQVLSATGGGRILEFGAGSGALAASVLERLATLGALPAEYAILEVSADLAERQRARLRELPEALRQRVRFLSHLPEHPMRGVLIANEVLDALPCERFVVRAGRVRALGVACDAEGGFVEREGEASEPLVRLAQPLVDEFQLTEGYRSEVCSRLEPWVASAGECLEQGVMLLVDYGLPRAQFYHPQRREGTLRCHFRHRAHEDPLILVGLQDLSSWVDFTRVAQAGEAAGLSLAGFTTQAGFLIGTGIDELLGEAADEKTRVQRTGEAARLLLPGEMGEAFKVMALARELHEPLRGFSFQDRVPSLSRIPETDSPEP
jgi:SAM-dependent MidA family methyltransferase